MCIRDSLQSELLERLQAGLLPPCTTADIEDNVPGVDSEVLGRGGGLMAGFSPEFLGTNVVAETDRLACARCLLRVSHVPRCHRCDERRPQGG